MAALDPCLTAWPCVVEAVATEDEIVAHCLSVAKPISIAHGVLTLGFPRECIYSRHKCQRPRSIRMALAGLNALDVEVTDVACVFDDTVPVPHEA